MGLMDPYKTRDPEGRDISARYLPGTTPGSMLRGLTNAELYDVAKRAGITVSTAVRDEIVNQGRPAKYDPKYDEITVAPGQEGNSEAFAVELSRALETRGGIVDLAQQADEGQKWTLKSVIKYWSPNLSDAQTDRAVREFETFAPAQRGASFQAQLASILGRYMVDPSKIKERFPAAARVLRDMFNNNPNLPVDENGVPLIKFSGLPGFAPRKKRGR